MVIRKISFLLLNLYLVALSFADKNDIDGTLLFHKIPQNSITRRVAVIGSGAGGSSSLHYLNQLFTNADHLASHHHHHHSSSTKLELTLFEKDNEIGGRNKHLTIDGVNIELGGSVYYVENFNVRNFTVQNNLTEVPMSEDGLFGVWDGSQFVFRESEWTPVTIAKLLWRYGLSPRTVKNAANDVKDRFLGIYGLLNKEVSKEGKKQTFENADEIYRQLGIYNLTQVRFDEYLIKEMNVDKLFLDEIGTVVTKINYGQNTSLSALAGFISFVGSGASIFSVKEGISTIWKKVVANTDTIVKLNTRVEKISPSSTGGYTIKSTDETGKSDEQSFDAVIIATPLEFSNIEIDSSIKLPSTLDVKRPYQTTHVTIVAGNLSKGYFGLSEEDELPTQIGAIENASIPFRSVSVKAKGKNVPIHKIFSQNKLDDKFLDTLFHNRSYTYRHEWKAYPMLQPHNRPTPPFVLADNLFYVNGMENAFSVIETESLSGQNIANILYNKWGL